MGIESLLKDARGVQKSGLGKGIGTLIPVQTLPPEKPEMVLYTAAAATVAKEHRAKQALLAQGISEDDPALPELITAVVAKVKAAFVVTEESN